MGSRVSGRATFGGIASGLDTKAIIDGLMQIERQPLQRIQSRRNEIDAQRSLMRQLNTKLLALRDAANGLDNRNSKLTSASTDEEFLKYTSSSSNEDVVQVTAGVGAAPGEFQVLVDQLARGSRRFSTTLTGEDPGTTTALAAGQSLTIDLPNGDDSAVPKVDATHIVITAEPGKTITLSALRDQINSAQSNRGKVRADILTVSEGNYRLVLTSTDTGAKGQLSVTGDLALEAPRPEDDAQGSRITIFGQTIERDSNDVEGVLTGVTLNLKKEAEKDDAGQKIAETVSIQTDFDAVSSAVQDFVDAYNDVMSFIDSQSKYNEQSKSAGPLSGDFMVREVQRRLREVASDAYTFEANPGNPFAPGGVDANGKPVTGGSISGIGIELVGNGRLRLDKDRLKEVLTQNATAVRDFLSGYKRLTVENADARAKATRDNAAIAAKNAEIQSFNDAQTDPTKRKPLLDLVPVPDEDWWDAGFFTNLGEQIDSIVRSGDGLLAQRDQQFATRLRDIDDSIDAFNTRLSSREEMLTQRFSALESVIAGLQNQQGFLGSLK